MKEKYFRGVVKPVVSKKYAERYLTKELIKIYKEKVSIYGEVIVPALIYDLLVLTKQLAKFRKEKKIIRANTQKESPNDWEQKDFKLTNTPTFDK